MLFIVTFNFCLCFTFILTYHIAWLPYTYKHLHRLLCYEWKLSWMIQLGPATVNGFMRTLLSNSGSRWSLPIEAKSSECTLYDSRTKEWRSAIAAISTATATRIFDTKNPYLLYLPTHMNVSVFLLPASILIGFARDGRRTQAENRIFSLLHNHMHMTHFHGSCLWNELTNNLLDAISAIPYWMNRRPIFNYTMSSRYYRNSALFGWSPKTGGEILRHGTVLRECHIDQ